MRIILSLLILLYFSLPSYAQWGENIEPPRTKSESPYFFIEGDGKTEQLPLLHTEAEVNISGVMADVLVAQVYKNNGDTPIEATYLFPASTNAAVYAMKMTIGNRTIDAKIEEKAKARADYEQAKEEGKRASLLEQQRPNVFQMNVANIMPGDTIKVQMSYAELLVPNEGVYEFVYPTVVGPRYASDPKANADNNDQWVSNPYLKEGKKAPYTFDLSIGLRTAIPINSVKAQDHKINVNFNGDQEAIIELDDSESDGGNRDFILQYALEGEQIQDGLLLYEGEDENFFLMMMEPPARVEQTQIVPREYIFIVDVSGSMRGYPLDVSKQLLRNLIGNLQPYEKFNVLFFASGSSFLSERSIPATPANIEKAVNEVGFKQGSGGTNLLSALQTALAVPKDEGYSRSFIIATDGYVSVEHEAFDLIRENLGEANFFSFGIGKSVNRQLVEGMARAGMGEPFIVYEQKNADEVADRLRKYIQTPVLTNIELSFEDMDVYDVEPIRVPDLMAERPIVVFGKYKEAGKFGLVKVQGLDGMGRKYLSRLSMVTAEKSDKNKALRNLWARHKIKSLSDYNYLGEDEEKANEVTQLGLNYNLLTNYTSFVAIDSEVVNAEGDSESVKQPLPLPDGVSNSAVGGSGYAAKTTGVLNISASPMMSISSTSKRKSNRSSADESIEEVVDTDFSSDEIFVVVEQMPEFPGGEEAMLKFIYDNLKYPESLKAEMVEGMVIVSFEVHENGKIKNIKVLRGVHELLDKEAIRIIESMPDWKPGKQRGVLVKVQYNLPIKFYINQ